MKTPARLPQGLLPRISVAAFILLFVAVATPFCQAQPYTWIGHNGDSWDPPTFWSPVWNPFYANASSTIVFSGTDPSHAGLIHDTDANVTLGSIQYNAGALSTTLEINTNNNLGIYGDGVLNHSGNMQTLQVDSGALLNFYNSAAAGNAVINANNYQSAVQFNDSANAGNATIHTSGPSSSLQFYDSSSGGNAAINANGYLSSVQFLDYATAGSATIIASGSISNVQFTGNATAGNAILNASAPGAVVQFNESANGGNATLNLTGSVSFAAFYNYSTAGSAIIHASGNSSTVIFHNNSSAGNAAITASGPNAMVQFNGVSTGSNASVNLANASAGMDISNLTSGSMTVGAVTGNGTVWLGGNHLTISGNGQNSSFSGAIADGGLNGGNGGSLTKTGAGRLTLTGSNSYSGGTTVNGGGTLVINGDAQLGSAPYYPTPNITLDGGQLMDNGPALTLNPNRIITLGAGGGSIRAGYNANLIIGGAITGAGGLGVAWDCGTVVLNGANSYRGVTTIGSTSVSYWNASGSTPTLRLGNSAALPGTDLIFGAGMSNAATLDMNGFNATVAALTGSSNAVINIGNGGISTLTVGNTNAGDVFQGAIRNTTGTLSLVKTGTGTQTLAGANSYSGGTRLDAGTLHLSNQNATGNSTVTMNGGGLVFDSSVSGHTFYFGGLAAASSGAGYNIALQDNAATPNAVALSVGNSNASTAYAGILSGSGSLTKAGSGTLTLTGANSYAGMTTISSGTLQLGDRVAANGSVSGPITDNAALVFANPLAQTYCGVISGTGVMNKTGAGTLTLTRDNSYSGMTTIQAGTLQLGDGIAAAGYVGGAITNHAALVFANPAAQIYGGVISGSGALSKISAGTLTLTGTNSYSGGTTVSGGALAVNGDAQFGAVPASPTVNITLNGGLLTNNGQYSVVTLAANRGISLGAGGGYIDPTYEQIFAVGGPISGVGGLGVAWDNGTVLLSGSNSYAGATTIGTSTIAAWVDPGATPTLRLGNNHALPGTDLIFGTAQNNCTMLDMNGFNVTVAALTGSGNAVVNMIGTSTLTVGNHDASSTFQGQIQNSGSLAKIGTGTLTLTSSNEYTGGTLIGGGQLTVMNRHGLGMGSLTLAGSGTDNLATLNYASGSGALAVGAVTLNGFSTIDLQANGAIQSSGAVAVNGTGNTINISGTSWNSGNNTLISGTSLTVGGGAAIWLTGQILNDQTLALGDTASIGRTSYTFGSNTTSLFMLTSLAYFDLVWTGAADNQWNTTSTNWQQSAGGLNPSGPNLAFVTSDTVYFTQAANGIAVTATGVQAGAMFVSNPSGTVSFNGGTISTTNLTKTGAGALILANDLSLTGTFLNTGNGAVTLAGALTDGELIQNGAGTLTLTGANGYTGATTIHAGTLSFAPGALDTTGTVDFTGNASLQWNGANTQDLSSRLKIEDGITATLDTQNHDVMFASPLQTGTAQTGAITKAGVGTLTLAAANPYTGATTLNAGMLNLANQNAVENSTVMMNGGNLAFDNSVSGNAFTLGGLAASSSGPGYDIALQNNAAVALSVGNNNADTTYAGVLSGAGSLTKIGAGTLTLTGSSSYTGGTILNAGTLRFANGALGATGTVDFTGNSTLQWVDANTQDISSRLKIEDGVTATVDTHGNDVTFASTLQTGTAQTGALTKTGAGTLALTATNNYAGGTTLNQGTLSFANGALGTAGLVDFTGNAALQWRGTNTQDLSGRLKIEDGVTATVDTTGNDVTFASALQTGTAQTGALTKTGVGTLTLTATSNYAGATTVNAGTLLVSGGGTLTQTAGIWIDSVAPATSATLIIDGTTSNVTSNGNVIVGDSGTGTLNLLTGAGMTVGLGTGTVTLAKQKDSSGTLNIGNGASEGMLNAAEVTGGDGTAVVNFNHNDPYSMFGSQITGKAEVNQIGSGTTVLTAANSYTGATTVSAGMLQVFGGGTISKTSGIMVDGVAPATNAIFLVEGGSVTATGDLTVGNAGLGIMTVTAGGNVANDTGYIGRDAGANGTATVSSSTWTMSKSFYVGYQGTGTLNITNGSIVTNGGSSVGDKAGSNGTVNVDGAGSTWTNNTPFASISYIGESGTGTLNIKNGGNVKVTSEGIIGSNKGANGTVNVDGAGSILETTGLLYVGDSGTATLNITNGGKATNYGGSVSKTGTVNVGGKDSTWDTGSHDVTDALAVAGTVNITAGGSVTSGNGVIGGVMNVGGKDATWTDVNLYVYEKGALHITSSGKVTNGTATIGFHSSGTVTVVGADAELICKGDLLTESKNTLDVADGSTLTITDGGTVKNGDGSIKGKSIVTVSGAGATWSNDALAIDSATLHITNGGKVTNSNGTVSGDATIIVSGTGATWTNNGGLVKAGLAVNGGSLTIQNGGLVEVSAGNAFYPPVDIGGTTGSHGTLNLLGGGTLKIGEGTDSSSSYLVLGYALLSSGTLNIGNGGGAGTLTAALVMPVEGKGTINFHHTEASYTFAPVISGSLDVNQIGSGMTILSASNSYIGATHITAGTLKLADPYATGLSTVTLNGGSLVFSNEVAGHAFSVIALSSTAAGAGYDIALADTAGNPVALTIAGNYGYTTGTMEVPHPTPVSETYAGVLSGNGSLILRGATTFARESMQSGTQTLAGANTYTGATTITYGKLNLANPLAAQNSTVTMNGGDLTFDKSVSGHAFTLGGLAAASAGAGFNIALHDNAATPNAVALSVGNNHADTTYAAVLSGPGSLIKIGTGTLTLSGANSYSGITTVTDGMLTLSGANLCSGTTTLSGGTLNLANQRAVQNSTVTLNGGSLIFDSAVTGHAFTFGGLAANLAGPAYRITLEDNASTPNAVALTVGNNDASTLFAGSLLGNGSLIKSGSGALALSGQNTYKGVTTITGGTLAVLAGGNIAETASVTVDSATPGTQAALTVDGTLPSSVTSMGDVTVGGAGNGTLTIQNWGTVYAGGRYGTGTLTLASGTGSAGTLNVGNGDAAGTLDAVAVTGGAGTAVVNFNHSDVFTFVPQMAGSIAVNQIGSGTTILTAANSHTGATTIGNGLLKLSNQNAVANSTVTMNGGSLVFDSSVTGNAFTFGGLAASSSGPGYDITLENNASTPSAVALSVGNNNADTTYAGVLSGAGSLTKIGSGTLTLTGSNRYTGNTTLSAGTLSFASGALDTTGTVDFAGNSTLQWYGANTQDLSSRLKIEDTITATIDTNGNDVTFATALQTGTAQTGALTKTGADTLTLTATNHYTGGTNLAAGTLSFVIGALGTVGTVDFTGNSTLQWNGANTQDISSRLKIEDGITATLDTNGNDVTFANALQTGAGQTGALTKIGVGTLTLLAANSYTGATTLNGGAVNLSHQNAVQNSTVSMNGGSLVFDSSVTGHAFTVGGLAASSSGPGYDIALQDNATTPNAVALSVGNNHADTTYAGVLSGAGSLTKIGTGTLILTNSNSYSGGTTVNDGTLQAGNGNAFGGNGITISGGVLDLREFNVANPLTITGASAAVLMPTSSGALATNFAAGSTLCGWQRQSGLANNTLATLLGGSTGDAPMTAISAWAASANPETVVSDVFELQGTGSSTFVLQLSYADNTRNDVTAMLGYLQTTGTSSNWVNAIYGGAYNGIGTFVNGAYNGTLALGTWGRDPNANTVWAVVDHNSDFAAVVPEPTVTALLALGALALLRRRKHASPT